MNIDSPKLSAYEWGVRVYFASCTSQDTDTLASICGWEEQWIIQVVDLELELSLFPPGPLLGLPTCENMHSGPLLALA